MAYRGGIDLGGTKIQAVIVDEAQRGRRPGAPSDADDGRPGRRRGRDRGHAARGGGRGRRRDVRARGHRRRLAGQGRRRRGHRHGRHEPARAGAAAFDLRAFLEDACGAPVSLGNDVQVATDAEFELGAGRPYSSLLGVFWGTGVGGGIVLDGKPWIGRDAAGEIGHVVVRIGRRAVPVRAQGLHGGVRRPRSRWRPARAATSTAARRPCCSRSWRSAGATRLTSGVWSRALDRDDAMAHRLIDRAVRALGAGIASSVEPARRRGGDHRRRPRAAARRAVRRADPRGDDAPPVRRRSPAGRRARGARRPRRARSGRRCWSGPRAAARG